MRASSIVTNDVLRGSRDPGEFLVPVIGGHSPETMVPVLSQTSPCMEIPNVTFLPFDESFVNLPMHIVLYISTAILGRHRSLS